MSETLCDGCGQPASPEHIARRIERLELASRYRPTHIGVLFLAEAPPPRREDYFYHPAESRSARQGLSRVLFDELMGGVGIDAKSEKGDDKCLAEFDRRGFFLADSLECPVEEVVPGLREGKARASPFELAHRLGPTIVKRIQHSYKPKHIVLLSTRTRHLIPILQKAGLRDRLLLYHGLPLHFPHPNNPAAQKQFREGLAAVLASAAAGANLA